MRPVGLIARGGVRKALVPIEAKSIATAGRELGHETGEVSRVFLFELAIAGIHFDFDAAALGSPHPNVDSLSRDFGADGEPPLDSFFNE